MEISTASKTARDTSMSAHEARANGVWEYWCKQINETCSLAQLSDVRERLEDAANDGNLPPGWIAELQEAATEHQKILKEQE